MIRSGAKLTQSVFFAAPRLCVKIQLPGLGSKPSLAPQHAGLDPYELKKSIEAKLKKFFTALGNLDRESTKT